MDNIKVINLKDFANIKDKLLVNDISKRLSSGPKKTRITISNPDTKEILGIYENKCVITGAMHDACLVFGLEEPTFIPSYNTELNLDHSLSPSAEKSNTPIICFFAVGDSGCGSVESDVREANFIDRIAPSNDIIPFRYVTEETDLTAADREVYFGRKTQSDGYIAYYFKKFETEPQLYLRYADGTEITNQLYNYSTSQDAECYVEMELLINRLDMRDYFDKAIGWENARFSTISLCHAWYTEIDGYKWYQSIYPYTKLNFPFIKMVDASQAIQFNYAIFF